MRVLRSVSEFSSNLDEARSAGLKIGLVPTMGALHAGHRSLVERAHRECGFVAVTIFVNPLQFNDKGDLDAYPRTLEADLVLLSDAGADVVLVPGVTEMYPDYPAQPATTVHVGVVTDGLEGAFRPGHFDGVATVVTKLLCMSGRCRAYFGEKDFQQVAVVSRLVRDLLLPVDVIACATVREYDGLALSSRNARLSDADRKRASVISRALFCAAKEVSAGERDPESLRSTMAGVLASEPGVVAEYVAVVDPSDLSTPERLSGEVRLLIAARVGDVRLIDNVGAVVGAGVRQNVDGPAVKETTLEGATGS
ncbi:MAG: pantoate--beta-alanine ligase [Acidimicrobiales bacterium]